MSRLPREIATTIILALFNKGEMTMTQLQRETGFSTITVLNHVEKLMTADLLEERREKELPKRRFLRLSEEGSRVASMLNLSTQSKAGPMELVELGVRAGGMMGYRKAATLLRQQNTTRDYAMAEFLISDLELLAEHLALVSKSLPTQMADEMGSLNNIVGMLNAKAIECRRHLEKNDIRKSAEAVAATWKELAKSYAELERVSVKLRGRKLEDLSRMVDFVIQKRS